MNDIKFRMWNNVSSIPEASRYFYKAEEVFECLKQQLLFNENNNHKLGYDHIGDGNYFEQFTGLKDKNGVEIYESDILDFGNGNNALVEFSNGCFNVFDEPIGWDFTPDYDNDYKPIKTDFKYCEVIGNIHQNPELL